MSAAAAEVSYPLPPIGSKIYIWIRGRVTPVTVTAVWPGLVSVFGADGKYGWGYYGPQQAALRQIYESNKVVVD